MDSTYKGWAGGSGVGGELQLTIGLFGGFMSPKSASHKPGGPKRRLSNTGVNIRPMPPI